MELCSPSTLSDMTHTEFGITCSLSSNGHTILTRFFFFSANFPWYMREMSTVSSICGDKFIIRNRIQSQSCS